MEHLQPTKALRAVRCGANVSCVALFTSPLTLQLCKKSFKKNSMLGTLLSPRSILTQQCLDLIKDLVQVLRILGVNGEYNLTPVEASGLHRQSNPAYF